MGILAHANHTMKATVLLAILAGISIACTRAGTERKSSVPVGVSSAQAQDKGSGVLTLAFVGDIMPGTTYPKQRLPEKDGTLLFKDAKAILQKADIAAGNMEGALADTGETVKKKSAMNYAFRIPTRYGKLLANAGLDFMSMANNHAFDFGLPGIKSTEAALKANGIAFAGIEGRKETAIVERGGVKYGFCAFGHNSYTIKHQQLDRVAQIIRKLKKTVDIVIVSFHGGAEGTSYRHLPNGKEEFLGEDRGNLREFAHRCIDSGADVVYGHGPHVVRAMELYKGHLIAYSLGNFCTPYGINTSGISGYAPLLELQINRKDGKFLSGKIHSFVQQYGRGPRTDTKNRASQEIRTLTASDITSPGIQISIDGKITKIKKK